MRCAALAVLVLSLAAHVAAAPPSTDRSRPSPVSQRAFRHAGEGQKVTHFYTFKAGPGVVGVTMAMRAKAAASNVDFELFDGAGAKLLYNYMNATDREERAAKQVTLRQKQDLLLAVTPDANAAYYAVALDGAVEIGAAEIDVLKLAAARGPLPTTGVLVVETKDGEAHPFEIGTVARVVIRQE
jgi:hypothetical protein